MHEARPAIPTDLDRLVRMEAGFCCAIHTCRQTPIELHHIVPWAKGGRHTYENLIALCPLCHSRADRGVIDRKALQGYKSRLRIAFESTAAAPTSDKDRVIVSPEKASDTPEDPPHLILPVEDADGPPLPLLAPTCSTVFFSDRFCDAFPGVRGRHVFVDPVEAIGRLRLLLKKPIVFRDGPPIWWWRGGNMHIDRFEVLARDTILLGLRELVCDELIAVNAGEYYQCFVYLRTKPSPPSGAYPSGSAGAAIGPHGYAYEEVGLHRGHYVTRAEYDDRSAVIDGRVESLGSDTELRIRFLSPYNLIIAAQNSPINNPRFDRACADLLNAMLRNQATIDDVIKDVLALPKRSTTG